MKQWLFMLLAMAPIARCRADVFAGGPTPPVVSIPSPPWTRIVSPFFIIQSGWTSIRYQQVYKATLFTNVPAECIYITSFGFALNSDTNFPPPDFSNWKIRLQINLSTTQRGVDQLSTNF